MHNRYIEFLAYQINGIIRKDATMMIKNPFFTIVLYIALLQFIVTIITVESFQFTNQKSKSYYRFELLSKSNNKKDAESNVQNKLELFPIPFTSNSRSQLASRTIPVLLGSLLLAVKPSYADVPYVDTNNAFALTIPPSWANMPRKVPTPKMTQFASEEVLFTSSSFAEGASLSITKSNAVRLMKDFQVEWWFAPLQNIGDIGAPALTAELLILQRQGDFEKKTTSSEIKSAKIENDSLLFDFVTPLAEGIRRRTIAKAFLRKNDLICVWVSSLESVMDADYGTTLESIRNSFTLT